MPALTPLQGPLTAAGQAVADAMAGTFAGSAARFYPSLLRDPQEPYAAVIAQSSDLTWRKGRGKSRKGFGLWIRPRTTPTIRAVPIRIRENIAACAALGLSYWSEAPPNCALWALDSEQEIHMVQVERTNGAVRHLCGQDEARGYRDTRDGCRDSGRRAEYVVPENDNALWDLADFCFPRTRLDPTPNPLPGPAVSSRRHGLKIDQQLMLFVAAQIRDDNSVITTLDTEILAALHSTRQYSISLTLTVSVARDLMPLIEAEIKRRAEAAKECAADAREAAMA